MKKTSKMTVAGMLTAILLGASWSQAAGEAPGIKLQFQDNNLQVVTDADAPSYYLEYRTPEGTWQKWNAGLNIGNAEALWFRAVFENGDVMTYEPPADADTFYSADSAASSVGTNEVAVTIGTLSADGSVTATAARDWMADLVTPGTASDIPTPANNQAYATPDPGNTYLYWVNSTDGRVVSWFLADDGTRKSIGQSGSDAPGGWEVVGTGDLNKDGIDDIMWFNPTDGRMAYWMMAADGYRISSGSMGATAAVGWEVVGTGDVNIDGVTDIMWFNSSDGRMVWWLMSEDGTRNASVNMGASAPGGWQVVGTADANVDGTPDIMWFNPSDGRMVWWMMSTNGTRSAAVSMGATAPGGWQVAGTSDADGDNVPDIMWFNATDGRMVWWLMNNNGTRREAVNMGASAPGGWQVVGVSDIDIDGSPDIMWFNTSDGRMAWWKMNIDGTRNSAASMGSSAPGGWTVEGVGSTGPQI